MKPVLFLPRRVVRGEQAGTVNCTGIKVVQEPSPNYAEPISTATTLSHCKFFRPKDSASKRCIGCLQAIANSHTPASGRNDCELANSGFHGLISIIANPRRYVPDRGTV